MGLGKGRENQHMPSTLHLFSPPKSTSSWWATPIISITGSFCSSTSCNKRDLWKRSPARGLYSNFLPFEFLFPVTKQCLAPPKNRVFAQAATYSCSCHSARRLLWLKSLPNWLLYMCALVHIGKAPPQYMPAPATMAGVPPGLEYLSQIDQLLVNQQIELLESKLWLCKGFMYM